MLSKLFFQTTRSKILTKPSSKKDYPKEWVTISKKSYPRFDKFVLPTDILQINNLHDVLFKRTSSRNFSNIQSLSTKELSTLLYYSAGIKDGVGKHASSSQDEINNTRRFYPSGGARYPLEVYLAVKHVDDINPGIYHYNPFEHSLEQLLRETDINAFYATALRYEWSKDASVIFIISALWERTTIKYGDFGYDMFGVEAGHMTQNLLLVGASLGVKACPLFGFNYDETNKFLDLDENNETAFYITALGK